MANWDAAKSYSMGHFTRSGTKTIWEVSRYEANPMGRFSTGRIASWEFDTQDEAKAYVRGAQKVSPGGNDWKYKITSKQEKIGYYGDSE